MHDGRSELIARGRSRALDPVPVTGDWVLISDGDPSYVEAVLPRRTTLSRSEAGRRAVEQVIAANVDIVAICTPIDDVNPRRLEREQIAVWESGATPIIIITKADVSEDAEEVVTRTRGVCLGVDVISSSAATGDGLDELRSLVGGGSTLALIGPSGVGKSSLVNALVGREVLPTAATRSDGKGRHTTTSRHLIPIPSGGLLLDTPGMREFAPWLGEDGMSGTFVDIEQLATDCRFADCSHDSEPGCAVLIAAASDEAIGARLASWRRLLREQAYLERRHDARLLAEEKRRWASISKAQRAHYRQ